MLVYTLEIGDCLSNYLQLVFKGKTIDLSPAQGKILLECVILSFGVGCSPRFHEMLFCLLGLLKSCCVTLGIFSLQMRKYLSVGERDEA